jgi:hypothetical protein
MILVVTLQLSLMSKHITWLNAAALIGSVALYFTFMFVFALLPTELEGVAYVAAKYVRVSFRPRRLITAWYPFP